MSPSSRALILFLTLACGTAPQTPCAAICGGCCDATGTCQQGNDQTACGALGNECRACQPTESCIVGACVPNEATSGASGGGGTVSGTGGGGETSGTGGGFTSGTGGGTTGPTNGTPVIASLTASDTLYDTSSITITAQVTDPDGPGNLSGGVLRDGPTGTQLGVFSGAVGSYTFTLRWSALNEIAPQSFGTSGGSRTVTAVFYDQSSAQATRSLTVALGCRYSGYSACGGACYDLQTSTEHCGVCNRPAPSGGVCNSGFPGCPTGRTQCGSVCADLTNDTMRCGSCSNDCNSWGAARGITSGIECYQSACQARVTTTSRSACSSVCAARGLSCTPRNRCRYIYSPYYTAASYGGCWDYKRSTGSSCTDWEEPTDCATVPAATIYCPLGSAMATFSSGHCMCR